MSFDVYVSAFRSGRFFGVAKGLVLDCFEERVQEGGENRWHLTYGGFTSELSLNLDLDNPHLVTGFVLSRPLASQEYWSDVFCAMCTGPFVLYFPGGRAPLVADLSVRDELPSSMISALGEPKLITTADDIPSAIQSA